jgi:hypothetical protein
MDRWHCAEEFVDTNRRHTPSVLSTTHKDVYTNHPYAFVSSSSLLVSVSCASRWSCLSPARSCCGSASFSRLALSACLRPSLASILYCAPDETPVHLALRVETRRAITQFHGHRHITLCPFDLPFPTSSSQLRATRASAAL